MVCSEVFVAETSLQRQLCARLLGALTREEWGLHGAGCMLGAGSQLCLRCLILIWKHKLAFKLACAVAHGLHVQVDMQVAGGHHRSLCLKQVLDYKGKVRNLFKYFYLTHFIQPSEGPSSSRTLMDAAVQPQHKLNYSYTHGDYSRAQVLSL